MDGKKCLEERCFCRNPEDIAVFNGLNQRYFCKKSVVIRMGDELCPYLSIIEGLTTVGYCDYFTQSQEGDES
ncbi:MAG: hypothetical protein ACOCXG_02870 [Nanoarchaeota archaeon]